MAEPLTQLGAWRDVLHPLRDSGVGLLQPSWPHPIDEHAGTIVRRRGLIGALDMDLLITMGMAHFNLLGIFNVVGGLERCKLSGRSNHTSIRTSTRLYTIVALRSCSEFRTARDHREPPSKRG